MESAVMIGFNLGKLVFWVHGFDVVGPIVVQHRFTRSKLAFG